MIKWSDVFLVFEKYDMNKIDVYAEHDVIYVCCTPSEITDGEDLAILEDFGFNYNEDVESFEKYV